MKRLLKLFLIAILACLMISGSTLSSAAACKQGVITVCGNCPAFCKSPVLTQSKGFNDLLSLLCDKLNLCLYSNGNCKPAERPCEPTDTDAEKPTEASVIPTEAPQPSAEPVTPPTEVVLEPTESPTEQPTELPTDLPTELPTEPPAEPTEAEPDTLNDYELEVIRLVNEIRRQYGLGELSVDVELSRVARIKSQDMRDKGYFSHTSPTYGSPFEMMKTFGIRYRTAGENIAVGYRSPQSVVDGWMNSEGHRRNILNGSFTRIGMGYVADGNYWTQMFIG